MSRCKGQELSDLILTDMETGGDGFADFDKCYAGQGHNSGNSPDYMNTSGSNNTIPNNRQGNYVGFAQNGTLIGLPFPNVPNGGGQRSFNHLLGENILAMSIFSPRR